MAKELVVTSTLTGEMIEAGAKLLERLEQEGLDIKAAMWLHQPESFIKVTASCCLAGCEAGRPDEVLSAYP